ncbi:HU family DNA-binding protein [uncultured Alistipes sp.]|uniref:HU family DNA-binding protein n=1 Tax=uncultured Alistipes sp. TaxID=538949 RepID=UPI0025E00FD7|nr:HU family DNA-binding protein [uncultured Alistipes sp.]
MTKADIVSEIAKSTGIEKVQVQTVVEAFMESVKGSLIQGNDVFLRGFGSFIVKKRAQKVARNILKGTTITIPEHNIPAFKPAKSFVAKVK